MRCKVEGSDTFCSDEQPTKAKSPIEVTPSPTVTSVNLLHRRKANWFTVTSYSVPPIFTLSGMVMAPSVYCDMQAFCPLPSKRL